MKKKLLVNILITTTLLTSFLGFVASPVQAAANFYLSPVSLTVNQNTNFSVEVLVNTGGDSVNAVQANLSYDAAKLEFVNISTTNSAFEIEAENTGGAGTISLGRGTLTAKSGDLLIATITFKALLGSGSATLSFSSGTEALRVSDNAVLTGTSAGGNYSFTTPPTQTKLGDLNDDGLVNIRDLSILLSRWRLSGVNRADLNGDLEVNIRDLSILLSKWGT